MPKCKNTKPEAIDDLIDELETTNEKVSKATEDIKTDDNSKIRDELLKLAEEGELDKSVLYIKKASQKIIDKLYSEYERKCMQKANEFLTDLFISKFSSTLGGLDVIEAPESLSEELKKDELLKRDVYSLVESLTPYLPFVGILSGAPPTFKHLYSHKAKDSNMSVVSSSFSS